MFFIKRYIDDKSYTLPTHTTNAHTEYVFIFVECARCTYIIRQDIRRRRRHRRRSRHHRHTAHAISLYL